MRTYIGRIGLVLARLGGVYRRESSLFSLPCAMSLVRSTVISNGSRLLLERPTIVIGRRATVTARMAIASLWLAVSTAWLVVATSRLTIPTGSARAPS